MKHSLYLVLAALLFTVACTETSTVPDVDDHDVVTTVVLKTISETDTVTFTWEDIDGIGGAGPNRIDTIALDANTTYACSIALYNRSVSPSIDLTTEIREHDDEHQFFYTLTPAAGAITYDDRDANNKPVGLLTNWITIDPATGTLRVDLSHFDDPKDKDGTTPSDETDVSVTFPVVIR